MKRKTIKKVGTAALSAMMVASTLLVTPYSPVVQPVNAATDYKFIGAVTDVKVDGNIVYLTYAGGEKTKITFLENDIFRFNMDPDGEFEEYPTANSKDHTAKIVQQSDDSDEYSKPAPNVEQSEDTIVISTDKVRLEVAAKTAMMTLTNLETGKVVWKEKAPLQYKSGSTLQTLEQTASENYYGGGTQNGRFVHTGEKIEIVNTNNWVDGGVASPNPFYWSTSGYGVLRDTWKRGHYDFGNTNDGTVVTEHEESRFDAYYFIDSKPADILNDYYQVTGNPVLLPEASFYLGHLNCYNRDAWIENGNGNLLEDGKRYKETNRSGAVNEGETLETLNGTNENDYKFSARAVIDGYVDNDMPFGWFLPNDGYGCGYGQSDTNLDDNVDNLRKFTEYAHQYGVGTGLWTQSNLTPNPAEPIHLQRDFEKEVKTGGIRTLKTDVAWVGNGYSFGLNGIKKAYDIISETNQRSNIITLDGWAGTQRYGGIWSGDQTGGNWEYIRFHIPTYIGQSLSGNPNIGSDMDGIFGGSPLITTRDYQWKIFTQYMLNMDGWGSYPKKPYIFGEDYTSINRMYLKLKAELMPYLYTEAYTATTGLPMIRAMFLNYPDDPHAYTKNMQYQFMYGDDFLVAPIYQDTAADEIGNDIRNNIYLPDSNQIWIDYFTGKQYRGGQTLNNFDAPIWKLPLFIKNGAIIPMYEENNNALPKTETNLKGLDKTKRIIEFYPDGENKYELYEDDGTYVDNSNKDEVNYGNHVTTTITSLVKDGTATLTTKKSTGTYEGYNSNRDTTFVVNVSKEPTGVNGSVGDKNVTFTKVATEEEFNNATGNVYFYNEAPNLNKYATEGSNFANVEITTTPKLYVKVEKTDVNENAITVNVAGFENKQVLNENTENANLAVPANLRADEENITPTDIPLTWDTVEGATEYQVETDGIIQGGIIDNTYTHSELAYHSTHTYRVRAINANGYSKWSDPVEVTSALDPYRNNIPNLSISTTQAASGYNPNRLIDREFTGYWFTDWNSADVNNSEKVFNFDFKQIYQMDNVLFYPHAEYLNQQPREISLYGSNDGKNYTLVTDHYKIESRDISPKEVPLNGAKMRYLRVVVHQPIGTYIALTEIMPQKVDGTGPVIFGDVTSDGIVDSNDLTMMQNYVGLTPVDADWEYVVDKGCDFNEDKVIDAFDVATVANIINRAGSAKDVAGQVAVVPNKTEVKAGETVELDIIGLGLENVNAYSVQLPYDVSEFDFVSVTSGASSARMTTFSKPRAHTDSTNEVFAVFANVNSKTLVNGTELLGKITLRAKADVTCDLEAVNAKLVGNVDSVINNALITATDEQPQIPSGDKEIKLTASQITSQADNVLQANMGVDKLIDGKVDDDAYRFEFQWGSSAEEVNAKLPHELTYDFGEETLVTKLRVQIRHSGNSLNQGALKDFTLYGLDSEGNREEIGNFTMTQFDQTFDLGTNKYYGIVLKATSSQAGMDYKLNIDETTFYTTEEILPTSIDFAKNTSNKVAVGRFVQVDGVVTPDDTTNPYYEVTSSDETVAKVTRIKTRDNKFAYVVQGIQPGNATIRITSLVSLDVYKEMTLEVVDNNKDGLGALINSVSKYSEKLFTAESYQNLVTALAKANEVYANENATQSEIDNAETALKIAVNELVINDANLLKDVTVINASSEITTAEGEAGEKENLIDGNVNTYWHTDYLVNEELTMPHYVTFDLGGEYTLNNVSFLPRQNGRNGDVIRAAIELSVDGTNFVRVGEYDFENDGTQLLDKAVYKDMTFVPEQARYVRWVILSALGNTNDVYASAAEVKFYGIVKDEVIAADKSALEIAVDMASAVTDEELENVVPAVANEFKAALQEARAILVNETATQETVDNSFDRLANAIQMLSFIKGDKTLLQQLVDKVKDLPADKYYVNTWETFAVALKEGQAILADENAMQDEIANAYDKLIRAYLDLRLVPDKDLLKDLINKAENVDQAKYTDTSYSVMNDALVEAKAVLADENATQDQVTKACNDLTNALRNLTEKPADAVNPGDTTAKGDAINTGDNTNIAGMASLLGLSTIAYLAMKKRK